MTYPVRTSILLLAPIDRDNFGAITAFAVKIQETQGLLSVRKHGAWHGCPPI